MTLIRFGIFFSIIGFSLHLIWEYFQCSPFFRHERVPPSFTAMIIATAGDLAILWLAYLVTAAFTRSLTWFRQDWAFPAIAFLILSSILIAILVEYLALKSGRWTYTPANPTLPYLRISVLPILQMALINPTSVYCSKAATHVWANSKCAQREYLS